MLMEMKAKTEAMRALAYVCAAAYDKGSNENDAERFAKALACAAKLSGESAASMCRKFAHTSSDSTQTRSLSFHRHR